MDYLNVATDYKRQLGRVADAPLIGPLTGPLRSFATPPGIKDGLFTLAGAAAGYWFGKKKNHKWLGLIAGASLGRNVPALLDHDRTEAIYNMVTTGAAIVGAKTYKRHPVYGFVGGWVAGNVATYAVGRR